MNALQNLRESQEMTDWDDIEHAATMVWDGPSTLNDPSFARPNKHDGPFTFMFQTYTGGVVAHTRHNGREQWSTEHPASRRDNWKVLD